MRGPESYFLELLFNALNESGLPYAVMRNHETLPYSADGSDLDILVKSEDEAKSKSLILQAVEKAGGITIGCAKSVGFFKIFAFGNSAPHLNAWWGQCIDVNVGLFFNGQLLLDDHSWVRLTSRHNGILVLTDGIAGVLGVLKEVLNNDQLPSRYLTAARSAATEEWSLMSAALQPMGPEALGLLHRLITSCASDEDITLQCRRLRSALLSHARNLYPLIPLWQQCLAWWSKVQRYSSPSGAVITILGVDGVGKSTVINAIKPVLDAASHNTTFIQHLRPGLLPPLARLKGKGGTPTGPVLDPHGSPPSGTLGSLFRLAYLTLDYFFGYWVKIRPKIAKQPAVVVFDRYAYDMALDPQRFRIGLPGWVAGLFTRLAPRPDLIICLHADPEVIVDRKQELSLEETRRQVEALRAFAGSRSNAVLISTEVSIEEVRERVLETLFDFFAKKSIT